MRKKNAEMYCCKPCLLAKNNVRFESRSSWCLSQGWHVGPTALLSNGIKICWKWSCSLIHASSMAASEWHRQNWVVVTETIWFQKPKTLTFCPSQRGLAVHVSLTEARIISTERISEWGRHVLLHTFIPSIESLQPLSCARPSAAWESAAVSVSFHTWSLKEFIHLQSLVKAKSGT